MSGLKETIQNLVKSKKVVGDGTEDVIGDAYLYQFNDRDVVGSAAYKRLAPKKSFIRKAGKIFSRDSQGEAGNQE